MGRSRLEEGWVLVRWRRDGYWRGGVGMGRSGLEEGWVLVGWRREGSWWGGWALENVMQHRPDRCNDSAWITPGPDPRIENPISISGMPTGGGRGQAGSVFLAQ
jgi:hypothetical protein